MGIYRVKSVQPLGKKKYKITMEGAETVMLSLYPSEIRRYSIVEGCDISDKDFVQIQEILYKRGKERALYYLKTSDKTAYQMRSKLREGVYPENIINDILEFLIKYAYIDDYRYTTNYISYNCKRKSIERMKNDLRVKGIERSIIDEVILQYAQTDVDGDVEREQIEAFCRRKIKSDTDEKQYNKIAMSLIRKGFKYDMIKEVMREVALETTT